MTETNPITPNPFASQAAITSLIDAESDRLDIMERCRNTGRHQIDDEASYKKIEDGWWALCQQRKPLDESILSMPIMADWQVAYKAAVIRRIVEVDESRHDELWGRLAYQIEAWACRPAIAA